MRVFKDFVKYMRGPYTMEYFTCEYDNIFEVVLFLWLGAMGNIVLFISIVIISLTCPLWFIPWLIYQLIKMWRSRK